MRSLSPVEAFNTVSPDFNLPAYTRIKINLPTNGSVAILNARAVSGSEFSAFRTI